MTIFRVKTGIPNLDELIEGGIPRGLTVLVSGGAGAGKTIFGVQYLYKGAAIYDEPGVYLSLELSPLHIRWAMRRFGWDLEGFEKKGLLKFIDASPVRIGTAIKDEYIMSPPGFLGTKQFSARSIGEIIEKTVEEMGAQRIAVDPISSLLLQHESIMAVRGEVLSVVKSLGNTGATSLLVSGIGGKDQISTFGMEEYVTQGVIVLHYAGTGDKWERKLQILKMHNTKHLTQLIPFEITDSGIELRKQF